MDNEPADKIWTKEDTKLVFAPLRYVGFWLLPFILFAALSLAVNSLHMQMTLLLAAPVCLLPGVIWAYCLGRKKDIPNAFWSAGKIALMYLLTTPAYPIGILYIVCILRIDCI